MKKNYFVTIISVVSFVVCFSTLMFITFLGFDSNLQKTMSWGYLHGLFSYCVSLYSYYFYSKEIV
jgi:Na+/pantothenate symporter